MVYWLVVWTPLKNISQLGWLFYILYIWKNMVQTTNQYHVIKWDIWNHYHDHTNTCSRQVRMIHYITRSNAIKGDDLPYIQHDAIARDQWGRDEIHPELMASILQGVFPMTCHNLGVFHVRLQVLVPAPPLSKKPHVGQIGVHLVEDAELWWWKGTWVVSLPALWMSWGNGQRYGNIY